MFARQAAMSPAPFDLEPAASIELALNALQSVGAPCGLIDASGVFYACNNAFLKLFSLPNQAAIIGCNLADFVDPNWRSGIALHLQQVQHAALDTNYVWDGILACAQGKEIKAQIHACFMPAIGMISLVLFDISHFRHDEMVLRKTLLEQQAILENAAVGILFSRDGTIVECNLRAAEMFGFTRREMLGIASIDIFPSSAAYQAMGEKASPLLSVGHAFQTELQLKRKDDSLFWCRAFARAIDPWQTEQGTIWIVEDINEQRNSEEKLRQTLLEMRAIMRNAPLAIGFHRDNRILRYNARYGQMFGFDGNSGVGKPSMALFPSQAAFEEIGARALPLLLSGQSFHVEMEMRRQDNSLFWANAIAYVVNSDKPQQGTIWIYEDISHEKRAEEESKHLLLEQKAILDNASVGIMFSRSELILRTNARLDEMFGYPAGGLVGKLAQEVFPDQAQYQELALDATRILSSGLVFERMECQFKRQDGSLFWGRIRSTAIDPEHKGEGTIWIIEDVTEARQDAQEMRRMLMELDAIMSNASVGIVFTKNRLITRFNQRFTDMFGYDQSHIGMLGSTLYPSAEAYQAVGKQAAPLLSGGQPFHTELEMRRMDGSCIWVQLIGYVLNPQDPTHGTIWIIEDRGEARRAEQSLRDALLENQAILESAVIGIAVVERGHTLSCNRKMEEIFNYEPGGIKGVSVQEFYLEKSVWAAVREQVTKDFAEGRVHSCEQLLVTKDGSPFWGRLTGRPFDLSQPKGRSVWLVDDITERREAAQAVVRARDELELRVQERTAELAGANAKLQAEVNERKQIEERIHHMAYHDSLTGLPNRALLTDRLQRAMLAAERTQRSLAIMFIDLDRFKTINDTLGHLTGDRLLREVAGRLVQSVRASDTVSRLGGDEFVVLVPDLLEGQEAGLVAQKIIEMLAAPIPVEGRDLHISPSIGICIYPHDGDDVETLMRHADTAMYHAKDNGRNNYQFFTSQMNHAAALQFDMENRLRGALGREEFVLYFQPIVDMQSREVQLMEVLLRWQQADGALIGPDSFIPIMEENGLIVSVGEWVIRRACEQVMAWQAEGLQVVPLAVNLSPRQFMHRGLLDSIAQILLETKIDPALLEFEITETALMQHGTHTMEILELINHMGIHLSIDDFGTGYSSLAYLKRFPVEKLKIDRAFVKDLEHSADDRAIVSAIIALSNSLQLAVVAEGVEDEQQYHFLREQGCRYAQGYLFSKPVPERQARDLLMKKS